MRLASKQPLRVRLTGARLSALAVLSAFAGSAAAAERTGWEKIPPGELAFVCRAELSESRPVLDGRPNVVFQVPLASEAIRVPPLLRKRPASSSPMTDAERELSRQWNEAWYAYVKPREDRFKELLLKSRPQEKDRARVDCTITSKEQAYRWGSSTYRAIPPMGIGAEFREIDNKPSDRPAWGKVYHEDFLPPDWTKGLPGEAEIGKAAPKPAPPIAAPKAAPQAGYMTVKKDTSLRDAGKAWDEQVKKSLAEQAQKNIQTAIKAAQANAKEKAELEAFMAEKRRRGSAQ